jgi:micrococcal nuclease
LGLLRILVRALFGRKSHRPRPRNRVASTDSPWQPAPTSAPTSAPQTTSVGNFATPTHSEGAKTISGYAYVIDGDTIIVKSTKIRLAGIDAPELDHPWGQQSKWAMVKICKGHMITAKLTGEVSYDRLVATCYLADGRDIGAELIKQGLALDWALFSSGKYRHLEQPGVRKKLLNSRAMHKMANPQ